MSCIMLSVSSSLISLVFLSSDSNWLLLAIIRVESLSSAIVDTGLTGYSSNWPVTWSYFLLSRLSFRHPYIAVAVAQNVKYESVLREDSLAVGVMRLDALCISVEHIDAVGVGAHPDVAFAVLAHRAHDE